MIREWGMITNEQTLAVCTIKAISGKRLMFC